MANALNKSLDRLFKKFSSRASPGDKFRFFKKDNRKF